MNETGNGKKRKIAIGLLAALLLLGGAGGSYYWYYTTKYVSTDDARISGTIVNVSSKVTGRVSRILAAEGDTVKAGQVLAQIDPRDILAQKAQAEASLAAAKANYEQLINGSRSQEIQQARAAADQAKASLDNAALNYDRMEQLFREGAISASQRDNALTTYQVAREAFVGAKQTLELAIVGPREEAIRAAAAQVKQAEAAVAALNLNYYDTTIVSPVDGIIAQKSVNPGEVVVTGQPLFSVIDGNDIWVNARIEETYIGKLQLGQLVEYTIDGYPGRTFYGKIYDLGSAATSVFSLIPTENASNNFTKVTQRIPIKISLPENSNVIFRPGMSVVIKVHLDKRG
jgi:Multidrug resistance efflux pump